MAEKPGDVNNIDKLDPLAVNAGAGTDPFLERYAEEPVDDAEARALAGDTGEQPAETEHLKAQIEETRSQMGETIDRIQEKLSFSNVSEQVSETVSHAIETAKDSIYEATIGKAVNFMRNTGDEIANSGIVRTAKENPLPLLLIGLGAGLLAYQSYNSGRRPSRGRHQRLGAGRSSDIERRAEGSMPELRSSSGSGRRHDPSYTGRAYDKFSSAAGTAYDSVSNAADSVVSGVSNAASSAYHGLTDTARSAYSGAGDIANRAYNAAGDYGSRAYDVYEHQLEDNPLAVGAIAAAIGVAVGFAIPASRFEDQLMGEARQHLMGKAQNAAGQLVDNAKQIAAEAGETIKEETKNLAQ